MIEFVQSWNLCPWFKCSWVFSTWCTATIPSAANGLRTPLPGWHIGSENNEGPTRSKAFSHIGLYVLQKPRHESWLASFESILVSVLQKNIQIQSNLVVSLFPVQSEGRALLRSNVWAGLMCSTNRGADLYTAGDSGICWGQVGGRPWISQVFKLSKPFLPRFLVFACLVMCGPFESSTSPAVFDQLFLKYQTIWIHLGSSKLGAS